jgi:uncharacterized membrane protein
MKTKEFLSRLQHDEIVAAVRKAEEKTSGEIRVFVSRQEPDDPVVAAQAQFERLRMTETKHRNGVLIFVAPRVRKFAIIGDTAVHAKCGEEFWKKVAAEMSGHFKQEGFTQGIVHGIQKAGELLAQHFPRHAGDRNQLSDEIGQD